MSKIRLLFLIVILSIGAICVILLLNFTAPNPTGRRYSSRVVTNSGNTQDIGNDGEMVLAADLGLPNNNASDQKQCLCREMARANTRDCNVCIPIPTLTSAYRIPDFIAGNFIAESKNVRMLRDYEQIQDYSAAAKLLKRPLWLFVRVDTRVEDDYFKLTEATGGGVVYYFVMPGYVDPVDRAAAIGFVGSVSGIGVLGLWEWRARRKKRFVSITPSPKLTNPKAPKDPQDKAARKVDDMQVFKDRVSERARRKLDEENTREDL